MQHFAIDLGSMESQICVRQPDGEISLERKVPTARLKSYLKGQPKSRVISRNVRRSFSCR